MNLRYAALALALLCWPVTAGALDLKAFYQERCAVCHGANGTGRGANGAPLGGRNYAEGHWLAQQKESDLVATILRGRGAMPGFSRQLSEAEARRLVATVLRPLAAKKKS